ncbi:MAG: polysaccharide deacetylase family protein [Prolixibacteraceae bacterium]|nr:polysaccharide deacetylase family protein [Prolixibacteraceae bacterium]
MRKIVLFMALMTIASFVFPGYSQVAGKINIPCFTYHRFADDRYPSTNITLPEFENHLKYLKQNNFNVVTLGEAVSIVKEEKQVDHKTVVLSVDDGYKTFYENAMPLLRKYGFTATLFINTNMVGNKDFMTWDEIREVENEGIEIGNHSHEHAYFVEQDIKEFEDDLKLSQRIFKEELGHVPGLYSYPYGEYTQDMIDLLHEYGLEAAAAQNSGVISEYSDLMALPRFPVAGSFASFQQFKSKTSMKALPVSPVSGTTHLVSGKNPPLLKLHLAAPGLINTKAIQCFIAGSDNCSVQYDNAAEMITMQSENKLSQRRTLYTITAPSATSSGEWYWYSYLWIEKSLDD